MEATQAFELDSDTAEPGSSGAAEVGCLTVEYPDRAPDAFPLFTGANVVGRSSSEPDRDRELLDGWQEEGVVQCVHGIPLHSNSISAQHAVLYLEGNGAFCFIKDLKSRNKTQIERQGNKIQLASDDRYGLSSGDTIRFGALSCRVTFAPAAERPGLPGAADLATQAYGLVGDEDDKENSPTGDTPAAVAASGAGASESGQGHPDQPLPTTAAQLLPPAGGTAQLMEGSYFPTQVHNLEATQPAGEQPVQQQGSGGTAVAGASDAMLRQLGLVDTEATEPTQQLLGDAEATQLNEATLVAEQAQHAQQAADLDATQPADYLTAPEHQPDCEAQTPAQRPAPAAAAASPPGSPGLRLAAALSQGTDSAAGSGEPPATGVVSPGAVPVPTTQPAARRLPASLATRAAAPVPSAAHADVTTTHPAPTPVAAAAPPGALANQAAPNALLHDLLGDDNDDSVWVPEPSSQPGVASQAEVQSPVPALALGGSARQQPSAQPPEVRSPTPVHALRGRASQQPSPQQEEPAPAPAAAASAPQQAGSQQGRQLGQADQQPAEPADSDATRASSDAEEGDAASGPQQGVSAGAQHAKQAADATTPTTSLLEQLMVSPARPAPSGSAATPAAATAQAHNLQNCPTAAAAAETESDRTDAGSDIEPDDDGATIAAQPGPAPDVPPLPDAAAGEGPGKSGAASGNPSASASWKTKRAHAVESDAATETKGKAVAADLLPEEPGNSCVARAKPASPAKSYIKPPVEHQGIESGWRSKAGAAESQLPGSQDVTNAMAAAGRMAAFFPATQAPSAWAFPVSEPQDDNTPEAAPAKAMVRGKAPATKHLSPTKAASAGGGAAAAPASPPKATALPVGAAQPASPSNAPTSAGAAGQPTSAQGHAQAAATSEQPSSPTKAKGTAGTEAAGASIQPSPPAKPTALAADKAPSKTTAAQLANTEAAGAAALAESNQPAEPAPAQPRSTRHAKAGAQPASAVPVAKPDIADAEPEPAGPGRRGGRKTGKAGRQAAAQLKEEPAASVPPAEPALKAAPGPAAARRGGKVKAGAEEPAPAEHPSTTEQPEPKSAEAEPATVDEPTEPAAVDAAIEPDAAQAEASTTARRGGRQSKATVAAVPEPAPAADQELADGTADTKPAARRGGRKPTGAAAAPEPVPAGVTQKPEPELRPAGRRAGRRSAAAEPTAEPMQTYSRKSRGRGSQLQSQPAADTRAEAPAEEAEPGPSVAPKAPAAADVQVQPAKREAASSDVQPAAASKAGGKAGAGKRKAAVADATQEDAAAAETQPAARKRGRQSNGQGPAASQAESNPAAEPEASDTPKASAAAQRGRAGRRAAAASEAPAVEEAGASDTTKAAGRATSNAPAVQEVKAPNATKAAAAQKGRAVRKAAVSSQAAPGEAEVLEGTKPAAAKGKGGRNAATGSQAAPAEAEASGDTKPAASAKGKRKGARGHAEPAAVEAHTGLPAAQEPPAKAAAAKGKRKAEPVAQEEAEPDQAATPAKGGRGRAAAEKGPPATGGRAGGKKRKATQEADVADEATQDEAGPSDRRQLRKIETREVRVLFSTCVDASLRKAYTKTIQRLGGSVAADSDQSFTHFLTLQAARGESDRGFKKSLNTLMALAAGRPIVAESWMDACTRSNAFVDPKDHLLQDSAAEKKLGFVLQTSYERAQHQLLLTGLHVFFTPGLLSAESDKGAGLRSLVTLAGGTVAASLDKDLSGDNAAMLGSWLVVGSEKDLGKERKWAQGKLKGGVPVHSRSMLVDSIMQQSLDRSAGVLFVS